MVSKTFSRVQHLGFRVHGFEVRIKGLSFRGKEYRIFRLGFRV
jgi:hypothetical protein